MICTTSSFDFNFLSSANASTPNFPENVITASSISWCPDTFYFFTVFLTYFFAETGLIVIFGKKSYFFFKTGYF
jgi:hypothetical protein